MVKMVKRGEKEASGKVSLARRIVNIVLRTIASVILVFIAFIVFAMIVEKGSPTATEGLNQDYRFTADVSKGLFTSEVNNTNMTVGRYRAKFYLVSLEDEIVNFSQLGGKRCDSLETVFDEYTNATFLECSYTKKTEFSEGDYVHLQIVSRCSKYCYKYGITQWIYPGIISSSGDNVVSLENVVLFPKDYYVFNTTVKNYSLTTSKDINTLSFKAVSKIGENNTGIFSDYFVQLKKKVDFSKMKAYRDGVIVFAYPTGIELESRESLSNISKVFSQFLKYAGEGAEYTDILIKTVEDRAALDGYAGRAYPGRTSNGKDAINLSIDSIQDSTLFHELCHLAEKPLDYPSWFSEGQAENCAFMLMKAAGREDEAKRVIDEFRVNQSKNDVSLVLAQWIPANKTDENDKVTLKGYGLAYTLMKEVMPLVDMPLFYANMRKSFRGYFELPNDAVICMLNDAASSDILPIFERYGFRVGDCSNVEVCRSDEVLGKDMRCYERCDDYFCKSNQLESEDPSCPAGEVKSSEDGRCYPLCTVDGDQRYYCLAGDYCFKNKCISCPKGQELYEDGYCYSKDI